MFRVHGENKVNIETGNVDKIHEFRIIDKEYHIDLSKYQFIEINDDKIKLLEPKKVEK